MFQVYHADNLDVIGDMEMGSIDAVIGDPPYQAEINEDVCPWDTWPPIEMWRELRRVTKRGGVLAFSIAPRLAHARVPDVVEAGWKVIEVGFWVWGAGRPVSGKRLKRCYDLVYFMGNETTRLYTEQARGAYQVERRSRLIATLGSSHRTFKGTTKPRNYVLGRDYFPANVACRAGDEAIGGYERIFAVKRVNGRKAVRHPTEKPVDLIAQIVNLASKPGEIVLDPWLGHGSTGEACLLLGRVFLGVDAVGEYVSVARDRLQAIGVRKV